MIPLASPLPMPMPDQPNESHPPPRMAKMDNPPRTKEQNPQSTSNGDQKTPIHTILYTGTTTDPVPATPTTETKESHLSGQTHNFRRGNFCFFIFVYVAAIVFIGQKVLAIAPLAMKSATPSPRLNAPNTTMATVLPAARQTPHTCGMLVNHIFKSTSTSSTTTSTLSLFVWSLLGWILWGSLLSLIYVMMKCEPSGQEDLENQIDEGEWVESKKREIELL